MYLGTYICNERVGKAIYKSHAAINVGMECNAVFQFGILFGKSIHIYKNTKLKASTALNRIIRNGMCLWCVYRI